MATNKTAGLDEHVADKLLQLLGDNDEFRELFQKDPQAALMQIGYTSPDESQDATTAKASSSQQSITDCCSVQQLASKESIRAAHNELRTMLLSGLSQTAPQLDAVATAE